MAMNFFAGLIAGLLGWTLLEYIIHYWLGHLPKGKTLISSEHLKHHKDILYFTPVPTKIRGAVPLLAILGVATGVPLGVAFAVGFVAAVAAGWTTYEVLHQSIHVRGPTTAYGRWAARNHLAHHFMNPNRNHGVTTPIWDFIFGTHTRVEKVSIRERDVATVPWLAQSFGDATNPPGFREDYEIRSADKKRAGV